MDEPTWLADEMLGRLCRLLRFSGYDVAYARGLSDAEVAALARAEHRRLLTRDRALARSVPDAVLLTGTGIRDQWIELKRQFPALRAEVRFLRCSLCNGALRPYRWGSDPTRETGVPPSVPRAPSACFQCPSCGQLYWEGSHTAETRARLARWAEEVPPP